MTISSISGSTYVSPYVAPTTTSTGTSAQTSSQGPTATKSVTVSISSTARVMLASASPTPASYTAADAIANYKAAVDSGALAGLEQIKIQDTAANRSVDAWPASGFTKFGGTWSGDDKTHAFAMNMDGTGYIDLTPANAASVYGTLNDGGSKFVGTYSLTGSNQQRLFKINTDGTGFEDLTPSDSTAATSYWYGFSADSLRYTSLYRKTNGTWALSVSSLI